MNAKQRKQLEKIQGEISDIKSQLESLRDELEESFDSKSETWQEGERGQQAETEKDAVSSAADSADDLENYLNDALS